MRTIPPNTVAKKHCRAIDNCCGVVRVQVVRNAITHLLPPFVHNFSFWLACLYQSEGSFTLPGSKINEWDEEFMCLLMSLVTEEEQWSHCSRVSNGRSGETTSMNWPNIGRERERGERTTQTLGAVRVHSWLKFDNSNFTQTQPMNQTLQSHLAITLHSNFHSNSTHNSKIARWQSHFSPSSVGLAISLHSNLTQTTLWVRSNFAQTLWIFLWSIPYTYTSSISHLPCTCAQGPTLTLAWSQPLVPPFEYLPVAFLHTTDFCWLDKKTLKDFLSITTSRRGAVLLSTLDPQCGYPVNL